MDQLKPEKIIVDAALFDLDGTIIDSVGIYHQIVDATLDRLDLPPVSMARLRDAAATGEFNWKKVFPEEIDTKDTDLIETAWEIVDDLSYKMFSNSVALISGAADTLRSIAQNGLTIAMVTSTPKKHMFPKLVPLEKAGIHHLFIEIITADDTEKIKPAADPLIECLKRLGIAPEKSVYIGDSRIDIKAGKAAGTKTIGVLTGFDDYVSLQGEQPDAILNDLTELPDVLRI